MWPSPHFSADLVTFTVEILTGKLHFLCSVYTEKSLFWNFQENLWVDYETYHEFMTINFIMNCNKEICWEFLNIFLKKLFQETSRQLLFGIHKYIGFLKNMNLNQQTEIKIKSKMEELEETKFRKHNKCWMKDKWYYFKKSSSLIFRTGSV